MALPLVLLTASLLAGVPAAAGSDQVTEARRLYNQSLYELAIKSASELPVPLCSEMYSSNRVLFCSRLCSRFRALAAAFPPG